MKKIFLSLLVLVASIASITAENIISFGFGGLREESKNLSFNIRNGNSVVDYIEQSGIGGSLFFNYDYSMDFETGFGAHVGFLVNVGLKSNTPTNYSNYLRLSSIPITLENYNYLNYQLINGNKTGANLDANLGLRVGFTYSGRNLFQLSYIPVCYSLNDLYVFYMYSFPVTPTFSYSDYCIYSTRFYNMKWGFSYSIQFGNKLNRNGFVFDILIPYNDKKSTVIYLNDIEYFNIVDGWEVFIGYRTSFVF